MTYDLRLYRFSVGQHVSVRDTWLRRWREATIVKTTLGYVTADTPSYRYHLLPASPDYVRPIYLVREGVQDERRAA